MNPWEALGRSAAVSEAAASLRKVNPVMFVLLCILVLCLRMALSSSESLTGKLITVLVGGILLFLGVAFEVRRIAREEDYAETAWKRSGSG